jgi:hypothetical protein
MGEIRAAMKFSSDFLEAVYRCTGYSGLLEVFSTAPMIVLEYASFFLRLT